MPPIKATHKSVFDVGVASFLYQSFPISSKILSLVAKKYYNEIIESSMYVCDTGKE